MIEIC